MNTLETLQAYANKHWATDKTRLTSCTLKKNGISVVEQRLWLWVLGNQRPVLLTNSDLTGSDRNDFGRAV